MSGEFVNFAVTARYCQVTANFDVPFLFIFVLTIHFFANVKTIYYGKENIVYLR